MSDTRFWVSSTPSVIGPIGVTPEVAAEMLESNGANRNKRDGNIDRYARDMASGHWRLTGRESSSQSRGGCSMGRTGSWRASRPESRSRRS